MAEWIKCDRGHECSTHEHMHAEAATATWRFESGGVGSYYCEACKRRIEANLARRDMLVHGIGVTQVTAGAVQHVPLADFLADKPKD